LAAVTIATATTPAPTTTTPILSHSPSHLEDALDRAFATLYDALRAFLHSELKLLLSTIPNPFLPPNQPTPLNTPKKEIPYLNCSTTMKAC